MSTASQVLSTGKDWISQSNGRKIIELPDRLLIFFNENRPISGKKASNRNQPMSIRPMVAQVCKNDLGGGSKSGGRMRKYFSTFVKNHFACGAAYTVLVDVQLISQSDGGDSTFLIGLFKAPNDSVPGSAFCVFKTDSILAQFSMDQSEDRLKIDSSRWRQSVRQMVPKDKNHGHQTFWKKCWIQIFMKRTLIGLLLANQNQFIVFMAVNMEKLFHLLSQPIKFQEQFTLHPHWLPAH